MPIHREPAQVMIQALRRDAVEPTNPAIEPGQKPVDLLQVIQSSPLGRVLKQFAPQQVAP